jgi:hypothetical protein
MKYATTLTPFVHDPNLVRLTNNSTLDKRTVDEMPYTNYSSMTNFANKYNNAATVDFMNDGVRRAPYRWEDRLNKFNQNVYNTEPMNHFGVKNTVDTRSPQLYCPGGMFGQVHFGKSDGTEMKTLPVRKQYNPVL